jgi:redox-sensing transcriptional repressor
MTVTSEHMPERSHKRIASERVVSRLILYRRLLREMSSKGISCVFSHQIAKRANATPAQLRRDLMNIGSPGTPSRGYRVKDLEERIGDYLAAAGPQKTALAGVGNLGRALLKYSSSRGASLRIVAALDKEPSQVESHAGGCPCFHIDETAKVVAQFGIEVALIAVPGPVAQSVANRLIEAGVQNLLNFSGTRLRVPADVFVEHIDIDISLEKFAFFARHNTAIRD